jgi:psp operon transcriptional activator
MDRLAFDVIHIPPLRARPEDIETLAYHFAVNITSELKREVFPGFAPEALAALLRYSWPGNVRELKNAVERSVYRSAAPDEPITEILFDPFTSPFAWAPETAPDLGGADGNGHAEGLDGEQAAPMQRARRVPEPVPIDDFRNAVAAYERELLEQALRRARYKQTTAAELLNLSYHQFRGLLKKYDLPARKQSGS